MMIEAIKTVGRAKPAEYFILFFAEFSAIRVTLSPINYEFSIA